MTRPAADGLPDQMERELAFESGDRREGALWHYTTEVGLRGILTSRCIHATEAAKLDDTTEITIGEDMVRAAVADLGKASRGMLAALWQSFGQAYDGNRLTDVTTPFVASFCPEGDDLPMWDRYGDGGAGFCLGFDPLPHRDFEETADAELGAALVRMRYDHDALAAEVRGELDRYGRGVNLYVTTHPNYADELWSRGRAILFRRAAGLLIQAKHPKFKSEDEWRLLAVTMPPASCIKEKDTARGRSRFVEVPLVDGDDLLPLSGVRLGPRAKPSHGGMVVELLRSLGYPNPESLVLESDIPLRRSA